MCGYQCCPQGVHLDLQTCDKEKEAEERGKGLKLCLPPPHLCCTQQEASHLESHLYYKHWDVYDMVEALNDGRQDEILKKKLQSFQSRQDWMITLTSTLIGLSTVVVVRLCEGRVPKRFHQMSSHHACVGTHSLVLRVTYLTTKENSGRRFISASAPSMNSTPLPIS